MVRAIREDDYTEASHEWPILDNIYYLGVFHGEQLAGLFVGVAKSRIVCECHVAMLPKFWRFTDEAYKAVIQWTRTKTAFIKLIGQTPVCNRLAVACNLRNGFKFEGVNAESFLKHGKLHDQIYFGYTVR